MRDPAGDQERGKGDKAELLIGFPVIVVADLGMPIDLARLPVDDDKYISIPDKRRGRPETLRFNNSKLRALRSGLFQYMPRLRP